MLLKRVENQYDAFNRWIGKTVDTDGDSDVDRSEAYVYDGNQIVLRYADNTDAPLAASSLANRYLCGPSVDQLLTDEQVTSLGSAGDVLWAAGDQQNTIRDLLSYDSGLDATTVADHAQYDSFGNRLNAPTVDALFGYTGRALDQDTGLQNNWNRWYDAATGRWISEDPASYSDSENNLYRYTQNGPLNGIDPSGLATLEIKPEKADSMEWYRWTAPKSGGEVAVTNVKVGGTWDKYRKDGGCGKIGVRYTLTGEAQIWIDPAKVIQLSNKKNALTLETSYGHEQVHVKTFITLMERGLAELEEFEKEEYDSITDADKAAEKHLKDVAAEIEKKVKIDKAHTGTDPKSPKAGSGVPPIGMMPANPTGDAPKKKP